MLIDTHAHLDFEDFDKDRAEVIKRASGFGVIKIVNIGCDLERAKKAVKIAGEYENIFAAVGVHPEGAEKIYGNVSTTIASSKKLIVENRRSASGQKNKIVAVGECGLDYSRINNVEKTANVGSYENINDVVVGHCPTTTPTEIKKCQQELFRAQIELAQELKLPLVIHIRDAYKDAIKILGDYSNLRAVAHCYTGNLADAKKLLDLGFLISITGIVTFKNARELQAVAREIPLEKMMIETDCPFLAPEPYRGKRNEPAYVKFIAEKIANLKSRTLSEVETITTRNAENFFEI